MEHSSCIRIPGSKEPATFQSLKKVTESSVLHDELITIANDVFGYNKWSHTITNQTIDFVEFVMGKYLVGCATIVKVQLNEICHEEVGYSSAEAIDKGVAMHIARYDSATNGLKEALKSFGGEVKCRIDRITCNRNKGSEKETDNAPIKDTGLIKEKSGYETLKTVFVPKGESTPLMTISPIKPAIESSKLSDKQHAVPNTEKPSLTTNTSKLCEVNESNRLSTVNMTEEELRQERKRRQKEKQEEYRRYFMEKQRKEEMQQNAIKTHVKF